MDKKLVTQILQKLDKPYDYVAKNKHGKSPEILLGDFIYVTILYDVSSRSAKKYFNISEQTFNRLVKRNFTGISLQGGGETWSYFLLSLIDNKKCHKCLTIQHIANFSKHHSVCKTCRSNYDTSEPRKEKNRKNQKVYYTHNKLYFRQKHARYRAQILRACPEWTNLEEIKHIYDNCPEGYHVDHIIPLKGKYICGLHIPINLQYLSIADNCSKGNYHESEKFW